MGSLIVRCYFCAFICFFFFFKQKTAYEMRISDWSSDVCSSDLLLVGAACARHPVDGSYTAFAASVAVLDRRDEQLLAGVFRRLGRLPCLESRFRPPALMGRNGVYHAGQTAVHPLFLGLVVRGVDPAAGFAGWDRKSVVWGK